MERGTSASSEIFCWNDGPRNGQKYAREIAEQEMPGDYLNTSQKRYSRGLAPKFKEALNLAPRGGGCIAKASAI
jgi:hypothetical protein